MPRVSTLEIEGLKVDIASNAGVHHIIRGISMDVDKKEVVGLIGESGSGKSTLAQSVLDINKKGRSLSGHIRLMGKEITGLEYKDIRSIRGRHIGYIPQSSMNALDPLMSVRKQLAETIDAHEKVSKTDQQTMIDKALEGVGISSSMADKRAYELSGGQAQRAMIAMAMLLSPDLIIADEPTTGLDAIIKRSIMRLMRDEAKEKESSLLVISHDMQAISMICDRIYIMYGGIILEQGKAADMLNVPSHPYTRMLLGSRIETSSGVRTIKGIPGAPPSTLEEYKGCVFYDRCERRMDICRRSPPSMRYGRTSYRCYLEANNGA
jgi:peptide/nickel transport system ATP-binding protein